MSELPRPSKPVSASRTEQVHIVMPADVNGSYTLFGGILMQWIDVVAGVDHLEFLAPAHINDTITLQGRVTYVGNTSMEVCVDTYVEHLDCPHDRSRVNRAYLTMVAIGADGRPARVPALVPETSAERADFEAGKERRAQRRREKKG